MLWRKIKAFVKKIYIKEDQLLFVLIIILGFLVGLFDAAFRFSIHLISRLTYLKGGLWLLSPVVGGFLAGALIRFCREAAGGGVGYVRRMLSFFGGKIPLKITAFRFLTSSINVGSGFSLGPEGPSVAIGAGTGAALASAFHLSTRNTRILVSIGAGSGISAAFGAPMSGVTYMLEEILGNFSARIVGASFIATVFASAVQKWLGGHLLMFSVPEFRLLSPYELFYYALLGLFIAPISVAFIRLNQVFKRSFKKIRLPMELRLAAVGGVISITALVLPQVMGTGYETLTEFMRRPSSLNAVAVLLLGKLVMTSMSIGSDASGGMYAPSFFLGAFSGIFMWKIFSLLFPFPIASPGAYAIVGMGAFFGGAFRVPLTAFLLIFELTKMNSSILLPLMLTTGVSYVISQAMYEYSATEAIMLEEGSLIPKEAGGVLEEILVKDVMRVDFDVIPGDYTVSQVNEILSLLPFSSYPVVDRNGNYLGMVTKSELKRAYLRGEGEKRVEQILSHSTAHLHPDMPMSIAMTRLADSPTDILPVLDPLSHRKLLGVLSMGDFMRKIMEKMEIKGGDYA